MSICHAARGIGSARIFVPPSAMSARTPNTTPFSQHIMSFGIFKWRVMLGWWAIGNNYGSRICPRGGGEPSGSIAAGFITAQKPGRHQGLRSMILSIMNISRRPLQHADARVADVKVVPSGTSGHVPRGNKERAGDLGRGRGCQEQAVRDAVLPCAGHELAVPQSSTLCARTAVLLGP